MCDKEHDVFAGVEALLAQAAGAELPPPAERARLRRAAGLTQAQIARELGLKRRETVAEWENGEREPRPPRRTAYLQLLQALAERFPPPAAPMVPGDAAGAGANGEHSPAGVASPANSVSAAAPAAPQQPPVDRASAAAPHSANPPGPARPPANPPSTRARSASRGHHGARRQLPSQQKTPEAVEFITGRVRAALAEHGGDTEAATAALVRKAIPDVMELLEICRAGGRYDFSCHPALPDLLHRRPGRDADDVWEARPKWSVDAAVLPPGEYAVTALDMNGAYLSALKTHLPIGALEHHLGPDEGGPAWDRRRSGIHRVTPPTWPHPHMPSPLGNREEPGPLWITEPTLRLLLRAADKGWCAPPLIHESFTSGASEGLLEKMRDGMVHARRAALEAGDEVTVEYLKAMYSKFVSTAGESNYNREIYRPDWVHAIRSQAFANLWHKAERAHRAGLRVLRVMGTDELHLTGDWRSVFTEGRDVHQVKVKDAYTVGVAAGEG
ncbi:XRE family transcriptional regulator [Streptomyces sp. AJS327]|uniref:helix-turn-helix transcriptional regulator n=1 Tax=Streptomyces sp. AJS327 TaxID=2545265 RepID=UPI0015E05750|nr:helix-turn-helix transcriptional regulator [Streptomyces sp. AJS327]MBA0051231.1 XRE family transcriptional regulator [Streptomyces sp. AJS327]